VTPFGKIFVALIFGAVGLSIGVVVGWYAAFFGYYWTILLLGGVLGIASVMAAQLVSALAMVGFPLGFAVLGFCLVWRVKQPGQ
jgi:hypothetical protein